jgi:hypothetical protein
MHSKACPSSAQSATVLMPWSFKNRFNGEWYYWFKANIESWAFAGCATRRALWPDPRRQEHRVRSLLLTFIKIGAWRIRYLSPHKCWKGCVMVTIYSKYLTELQQDATIWIRRYSMTISMAFWKLPLNTSQVHAIMKQEATTFYVSQWLEENIHASAIKI